MAKLSQKKPKKERDRIGLILYLLYVFFLGLSIVFVVRIIGIQWFWEVDSDLKPYFLPSSIRCDRARARRHHRVRRTDPGSFDAYVPALHGLHGTQGLLQEA